ncbi:MAG: AI-2E family transporter [Bradymonadia bacterium]
MDNKQPKSEHGRTQTFNSGTQLAIRLSSRLLVIVLLGVILVSLKAVLIPFVLAVFFAFLLRPIVKSMVERRVPMGLAITFAELVAVLPMLGLITIFLSTAGPLSEQLPKYQDQIVYQLGKAIDGVLTQVGSAKRREAIRKEIAQNLVPGLLNTSADFIQRGIQAVTTALGTFLLALVFSAFMLLETARIREKFIETFGRSDNLSADLEGISSDVRRYVVAKTFISALTAVAVWIFLELTDVDFALFWGLIAFPLNFIPTVGAFVASIPPILLASIDPTHSAWSTVGVAIGLLTLNGVIGAVLDPRYVGSAVRVSPLVVFLSVLIWGVVWGPIGMILAVPIMVCLKVVCGRVPALHPFARFVEG